MKIVVTRIALIAIVFLLPAVAFGQSEIPVHKDSAYRSAKVRHYVRTHKVLVATSALILLSYNADAWSAARCVQHSLWCKETNPLLSPRPGADQFYAVANLESAGLIGLNAALFHEANKDDSDPTLVTASQFLTITLSSAFTITEIYQAKQQYDWSISLPQDNTPAGRAAAARARLAQ